jgi:hypothetical protein
VTQNRKEKRKKTGRVAAKNREFLGEKWESDGNKMGNDDQEYAKMGSRPGEKRSKVQDKSCHIAKRAPVSGAKKGRGVATPLPCGRGKLTII